MKLHKKQIFLALYIITSILYGYSHINSLVQLSFVSKVLITPMLIFHYIAASKLINKLFLASLIFIFCSNILLFNASESVFIVGMGCILLFVLVNMVLIANKIGEIKIDKFCLIVVPNFSLIVAALLGIFNNSREITWLFYVFGGITAIYTSFSIYLYTNNRNNASLFNLIGVVLFIFSAITKALDQVYGADVLLRVLNVILYTVSLFFISQAFINFDSEKKPLKNN